MYYVYSIFVYYKAMISSLHPNERRAPANSARFSVPVRGTYLVVLVLVPRTSWSLVCVSHFVSHRREQRRTLTHTMERNLHLCCDPTYSTNQTTNQHTHTRRIVHHHHEDSILPIVTTTISTPTTITTTTTIFHILTTR